jgi:hypothetical protein
MIESCADFSVSVRVKKRLRMKRRVGEFAAPGFQLIVRRKRSDGFDAFPDAFIVTMVRQARIGYVVYEDSDQVVAEPFAETRTCSERRR